MAKSKSITIGDGLECPKCNQPMKRKESLKDSFYDWWDFCKNCNHTQFYKEGIKKIL